MPVPPPVLSSGLVDGIESGGVVLQSQQCVCLRLRIACCSARPGRRGLPKAHCIAGGFGGGGVMMCASCLWIPANTHRPTHHRRLVLRQGQLQPLRSYYKAGSANGHHEGQVGSCATACNPGFPRHQLCRETAPDPFVQTYSVL